MKGLTSKEFRISFLDKITLPLDINIQVNTKQEFKLKNYAENPASLKIGKCNGNLNSENYIDYDENYRTFWMGLVGGLKDIEAFIFKFNSNNTSYVKVSQYFLLSEIDPQTGESKIIKKSIYMSGDDVVIEVPENAIIFVVTYLADEPIVINQYT